MSHIERKARELEDENYHLRRMIHLIALNLQFYDGADPLLDRARRTASSASHVYPLLERERKYV